MDKGVLPISKGITILTYHGLVEKITHPRLQRNFHTINQFEAHIALLVKKKYHFLSGSDLAYYKSNRESMGVKKMVCITFDDGYQNNLAAIAILKKYNLPGIFFISTDSINSKESIWTVNLSLLLLAGNTNGLDYRQQYYNLTTIEQRNEFFQLVRIDMKKTDASTRKVVYEAIKNQFPVGEIERLITLFPCFKMLTWDEIRSVQDEKIQFHSHGCYHEIHNMLQPKVVLQSEIIVSKLKIEEELGGSCFLFAYPNGNWIRESFGFLNEGCYSAALQLNGRKMTSTDNPFALSRITPNGKIEKFKIQLFNS